MFTIRISFFFLNHFLSYLRAFAQMKIKIPSKTVLGNSEQSIEDVLFDLKLPKINTLSPCKRETPWQKLATHLM